MGVIMSKETKKTDQYYTDVDLTKVNIPRMQMWYDALVSGDYNQIPEQLRDGDEGMCCLGVACEVVRKHTKQGKWTVGDYFDFRGESGASEPPDTVAKWFGWANLASDELADPYITNPDTRVKYPDTGKYSRIAYSVLNDSYKMSFKQIAKSVKWMIGAAKRAQKVA